MNIVFLSDASQPCPGTHGLGIAVHTMATGLLHKGHNVTLIATEGSSFEGRLITPTPPDYNAEAKLAQAAIELMKHEQVDVVYDHSHRHDLARIFPNAPVVNHHHDKFQNPVRCAILCSEGQRQLMGYAFANARVIHNALDASEFIPSYRHDGYAAYVGVSRGYKQPALAIEAAARARIPLRVAGAGFGDILDGFGNTQYVGVLDRAGVKELYRGAAVYLQMGNIEAFPLTNIEAGLSGTPTVAFPSGGNLDYVKAGINGVLIDTTCEDMVDAVVEGMRAAMSMNRREVREYTAEHFGNVDRVLGEVEAALESCAGGAWW